ncbi:MAG: molybdopterin cofactor-binding domain-containing protein [Variibacter sp.]
MQTRRAFLIQSAAVGGGLSLGIAMPMHAATPAQAETAAGEINAWVVVQPDDAVIVRIARAELGQGIATALPMLLAEELECDWSKVRAELVAPHENLARKRVWGDMSTGASRSVKHSQEMLREAGAAARTMLIAAAAARWNVSASECAAKNSLITHAPSGRSVTFGAVAADAARLPPPQNVALKPERDWRLIGTRQRQRNSALTVSGQAVYGIDVTLPNLRHGAILQCPVFQGTLKSVDASALAAMKGAPRVVKLDDAVAVVADTWWRARKALEALKVEWDEGEHGAASSAAIADFLREGLVSEEAEIAGDHGDVDATLAKAATRVSATYSVPFLAHETLEPQNCTAHVTADRVEIWVPTQDGENALETAATAAGMPPEKVIVHRTMVGGGFGRRGMIQDFVRFAVQVAKEVGEPVKLLWTREEDTRHDFYRPVVMARLTGALDAEGTLTAWDTRISGQSVLASLLPEMMMMTGGLDKQFLDGLLEVEYAVRNRRISYAMRNTHVPAGVWRAVNHGQNAFFKESFIDEAAHAAKSDPYHFRRKLLAHNPRARAVLDAAAKAAAWESAPPAGRTRGIALHEACGTVCAHVVEISVGDDGALRVHRIVAALDPGHVVNPLTIEKQTQGAIVYALEAALYGEITIADGRVMQGNFDDYRVLRLAEMPEVKTVIVPSGEGWGGIGEPPLPPLAPALCNAVFAATGKRIRSLPLKNHDLRKA